MISRKKKWKSLGVKNSCWFSWLALQCESAESVENWKNFVLLADKGFTFVTDYFLLKLKLISELQEQ